LVKPEMIHLAAIAFAIGLLVLHHLSALRMQAAMQKTRASSTPSRQA
jgi:propanediol dehydratase large subunit